MKKLLVNIIICVMLVLTLTLVGCNIPTTDDSTTDLDDIFNEDTIPDISEENQNTSEENQNTSEENQNTSEENQDNSDNAGDNTGNDTTPQKPEKPKEPPKHKLESIYITLCPTENTVGTAKISCVNEGCTYSKELLLPVLDEFNYVLIKTEPTCTKKGNLQYTLKSNNLVVVNVEVDAVPHAYSKYEIIAPTVDKEGSAIRYCTGCNLAEELVLPKLNDVDYDVQITDSTCINYGQIEYTYLKNKAFKFTVIIEKTGHTFADWIIEQEPTINDIGTVTRKCHCGKSETKNLPYLDNTNYTFAIDYTKNSAECTYNNLPIKFRKQLFSYVDKGDGTCSISSINIPLLQVKVPEYIDKLKVVSIEDNAFSCDNYDGIDSITFVEGITKIGKNAFYGQNIKEIILPNSVEQIDSNAFKMCNNLKKVEAPNLKRIEMFAFANCGLEQFILPSSVEFIGKNAFSNFNNFTLYTSFTKSEILQFEKDGKFEKGWNNQQPTTSKKIEIRDVNTKELISF